MVKRIIGWMIAFCVFETGSVLANCNDLYKSASRLETNPLEYLREEMLPRHISIEPYMWSVPTQLPKNLHPFSMKGPGEKVFFGISYEVQAWDISGQRVWGELDHYTKRAFIGELVQMLRNTPTTSPRYRNLEDGLETYAELARSENVAFHPRRYLGLVKNDREFITSETDNVYAMIAFLLSLGVRKEEVRALSPNEDGSGASAFQVLIAGEWFAWSPSPIADGRNSARQFEFLGIPEANMYLFVADETQQPRFHEDLY